MEDHTSSSLFATAARSESPESIRQSSSDAKPLARPRDPSTSLNPPTKKTASSRAAASTSNSPFASRESSPVRPQLKGNSSSARSAGAVTSRSRKNSVQEISPSRSTANSNTNPPSAAATQRALSAASIPSLLPVQSDPSIKTPVPFKPGTTLEIKETPRWPISPRLRSPPPISNKHTLTSPRKTDLETPSINVPRTEQQEAKPATADAESEDLLTIAGMRTPARGASGSTLETVQEISLPNTPGPGLDGVLEKNSIGKLGEDNVMDNAFNKSLGSKGATGSNESGSESGGRSEKLRSVSLAPPSTTRPGAPAVKAYSTSTATGVGRGKSLAEGIARNMTVETETVSSVPQVAVGGVGTGNGSIRTKPSSETIRPKKEKKKTTRKAPSVNAGTASSKADFFEATVASAVDEANSSDSEETFVYESNPPENTDRPRRFHSRTPSVTSMASQADQRTGGRALADPGHSVAMKKSMKFANTYNSSTTDATTKEDDGRGTARSSAGTGRGTTHHHHIGRWGRHGGNGHASLFDNESPFPNAAKSKLSGTHNPPKQTSQPSSPRMASKTTPYGKRSSPISSGYDMDDGADDERTPLVSTIRSGRSGRNRRPGSSLRQLEHQAARQNRSFLARFAGCIVISLMIVMVFTGAIGFMFATTQPLSEVSVIAIKNVLASEQEIIFDLKVSARNPNLVAVTVDTSDIFVFAKSKYAGTDSEWWSHPPEGTLRRSQDDVDDPEDGSPTPSPNFDIGEVYALQSPLIFEGSPFHHFHSVSTGQIRISHPGNTTIPSGSERWGRVVEHEFDLIIRGTLIYTLPLTQKIRTVIVEGRITVKPNASEQDPDRLPKPISDGAGGEIGVTA